MDQPTSGEGERTSTIEPRELPYSPASQLTLRDDRGNAALERRGIRTPDSNEHHHDERVVSGPTSSPFSYVHFAACNQAKIDFYYIAGVKGVQAAMALIYCTICTIYYNIYIYIYIHTYTYAYTYIPKNVNIRASGKSPHGALPHLLIPEYQEETYAVPNQADILAEPQRHGDERKQQLSCHHAHLEQHKSAWRRDILYVSRWPPGHFLHFAKDTPECLE